MKCVCDKSGVFLLHFCYFQITLNTFSKPTHFMSCTVTENYAEDFYTLVMW
jgi:hypothetical protein